MTLRWQDMKHDFTMAGYESANMARLQSRTHVTVSFLSVHELGSRMHGLHPPPLQYSCTYGRKTQIHPRQLQYSICPVTHSLRGALLYLTETHSFNIRQGGLHASPNGILC